MPLDFDTFLFYAMAVIVVAYFYENRRHIMGKSKVTKICFIAFLGFMGVAITFWALGMVVEFNKDYGTLVFFERCAPETPQYCRV